MSSAVCDDLNLLDADSSMFFFLLITFTFYNITMSISHNSKSFLGNNKMLLVSSFSLLNLAIKSSIYLLLF